MKPEAWPAFSFTDVLRPSEGWKVEHAILATYSADLVVVATALLALTGCDLNHRRTGSRVELVKAIEALRGRVRVLAQANRIAIPRKARSILKLMDNFLGVVSTDENTSSWHPKIALVRYHRVEDPTDRQWRVWIGSRNLTDALNWDAGMVLTSRADGRGQTVSGLVELVCDLTGRANLTDIVPAEIKTELAALTWECPAGCKVIQVDLFGPRLASGFPAPPKDIERLLVVSPFLDPSADASIVREVAQWGGANTHRTLISTAPELQRLWELDADVFNGFAKVCTLPFPELPVEGMALLDEEAAPVETVDGEDLPPAGLHAKLLLATSRTRRLLWLGSANATRRAWDGRNFEVVAATQVSRDTADALIEFATNGEEFKPSPTRVTVNPHEQALEHARKALSAAWTLRQEFHDAEARIIATAPPPLIESDVRLEVAALGGSWNQWPVGESRLLLPGQRLAHRCDLVQVRLLSGDCMCAWLQLAPCDPPPDVARDRALIAQYLDPRTFVLWIRSLLADEPENAGDSDWDDDGEGRTGSAASRDNQSDLGLLPSIEEILRAWARDADAFRSADEKVRTYLPELERRAGESNNPGDVHLLQTFQKTWNTLAFELR